MNILITGCAGFIGFSLARKFLNLSSKYKIIGFDNLNNFYSSKLKKKRLTILKEYKNFKFYKLDLLNKDKIKELFRKYNFYAVYHLAAQAGVRYVITHPEKFIESNIYGFHNLMECVNSSKVSKFFYASSSSVYGDLNKFPADEKSKLFPKNIYGLSKKINEEYVEIYSNKNIKYIGLRFFTVYGEWGRPDMLILKFLDHAKRNKLFLLNNYGNHWRDFTYIDDVTNILVKLLNKKYSKNEIFNICSNNPIWIKDLIKYLQNLLNFKKIKNIKSNKFEVKKTHGKNDKVNNFLNYRRYSNFYRSIDQTVKWYRQFSKII